MSMIMSHLQRKPGSCPRPDCTGMGTVCNCDSNVFTWYDMHANISTRSLTRHSTTCHLNFYSNPNDSNDASRRINISGDDIARQQIDEDLRLYGIRPEPPDAVEVDESIQLASLPPKRDASEFAAAVDSLAKADEKGKTKEFNNEFLSVMDWNSGASPLDAWLNQSAVPFTTTALKQQERVKSETDILAQEIAEMKFFRNVHMTTTSSPERHNPPLYRVEVRDSGVKTDILNIMDRYPAIPNYLARRLAQANHDRAERLHNKKRESMVNNDCTRPHTNGTSASNVPDRATHQLMTPETQQDPILAPVASQNKNDAPFGSTDQPSSFISTPLNEPCRASTTAQMDSRSTASDNSLSTASDSLTGFLSERSSERSPLVDFWTGGGQSWRPASAHSRSSSTNSSLHGRPAFDPQEQNPTFESTHSTTTAYKTPGSPALPHPPVELSKATTFNCDICGQIIQAKHQLEWQ